MKLYTYGYSGGDEQALAELMAKPDTALVDVRLKPFTQLPGWSMRELARKYGRQYRWLRQLGNESYKGGPIVLNDAIGGANHVRDLIEHGCTVVLLCGCKNPETCHRTHAAKLIRGALGGELEIVHLVKESDAAGVEQPNRADPQGLLFGA